MRSPGRSANSARSRAAGARPNLAAAAATIACAACRSGRPPRRRAFRGFSRRHFRLDLSVAHAQEKLRGHAQFEVRRRAGQGLAQALQQLAQGPAAKAIHLVDENMQPRLVALVEERGQDAAVVDARRNDSFRQQGRSSGGGPARLRPWRAPPARTPKPACLAAAAARDRLFAHVRARPCCPPR